MDSLFHWRRFLTVLFTAALSVCAAHAGNPLPADPEGHALLQSAQRIVAAYHAGQPKSDAVLRVVYFHPSDRDPLPKYAERLDRVLTDVSDFYRDGLRRFGIESEGLPLERKDGRLVLHLVRGKRPASAYNYESGDETVAEIRAAMKDTFDLDHEHVLAIYGLCRKEPDGRYVFDAPYYGGGTQRGGFCHAADCELLDPRLLIQRDKKMVFTEHYYPRVDTTVAKFNSWYLGGVAHELGHGLGLPHDAGMAGETPSGTALMGKGNLSYRNDLWGGKAPAYFSQVTALRFLSHPFVTGSNRGRFEAMTGGISDATFTAERDALRIQGKVGGSVPPYAVVAYVWDAKGTDHSARTFPVLLNGDTFELVVKGLRPANYQLRLTSLHANGGVGQDMYRFGVDAKGRPELLQKSEP